MNGGRQSSGSRRINSPIPHWSSPQGISHPPLRLPAVETAFCLSEKRVALRDADVEAWAVAGEDPGDGSEELADLSPVVWVLNLRSCVSTRRTSLQPKYWAKRTPL
jgi:hypothetical protein